MKAKLLLENGKVFIGESFGYENEGKSFYKCGEIVFNTSMTGYQELLTDPSYNSQIVNLTYPIIGNYGVNDEDLESDKIHVSGLIVREYQKNYSNYRAKNSLANFLKFYKILAIEGIDTRYLTRLIRKHGTLKGIIIIGELLNNNNDFNKLFYNINSLNIKSSISCKKSYSISLSKKSKFHVVVLDFGVKKNALKLLFDKGCKLTILPSESSVDEIMIFNPDGIFLSSGPGDPSLMKSAILTIKKLIVKKRPILGICLGHQLISLALGAKTEKLKFGHRGINHSVKNLKNQLVEISSQNHGFVVIGPFNSNDVEVTHINLNDNSIEGICHKFFRILSVQYHPESSPGPRDSIYIFDKFIQLMKDYKNY